jgi:hypothetical protein
MLLAALLGATSPAGAILTWEASGGWNFGGTNSYGGLTQPPNPPAVVTSGGDFSNGGAYCPVLGTPNYICGYFYGKADLVGSPGGLVTMHASARLRQKDATGVGFVKLVYGGARVWFINAAYGAVATPVAQAVFNFGLHGTRSESSSNGSVLVEAKGVAFLVADKQYFVQCFADVCQPIKVPISQNWNPGAPNGTAFYVDLRADARITAPLNLTFDAEAIADYKDTLELLSVELQDASEQTIPNAALVVHDGQGQPVYTIPNTAPTTTTTLPGATATTTTTVPGATVTTTTLPVVCPPSATFVSVGCRLAKLLDAVRAAADGPLAVKLVSKVAAAQQAVAGAEQLVTTSRKRSSKSIVKALKALAAYKNLLKSRAAKRALGPGARAALAEPLAALRADLKALRATH